MGSCCHATSSRTSPVAPIGREAGRVAVAILLGGLSMSLSLGVNLTPPTGETRVLLHSLLAMVALFSLVFLADGLHQAAWAALRRGTLVLEHAFLLGLHGSFLVSLVASFTGQGAIYYEVVVLLIAIYLFGQMLTRRQAAACPGLESMIPGLRAKTWRQSPDGGYEEIDASLVAAGDILRVREGEVISADGKVSNGSAYLESRCHSGETAPQVVGPGAEVLAGSRLLDGELHLVASRAGTEREVDRLFAALATGPLDESPMYGFSRRVLRIFVPFVVGVAAMTFIAWALAGKPAEGLVNALTVTVVACPCAIGVALPLALRQGQIALWRLGVVPAAADLVERLAEIEVVAFDKTGTLSDSNLVLQRLELAPDAPEELPAWLGQIQRLSSHPAARPFWNHHQEVATFPDPGWAIEVIPGRGIRAVAKVEGWEEPVEILVGNSHLAREMAKGAGETPDGRDMFILIGGKIAGQARLGESPRTTGVAALARLREQGYGVAILTGDSFVPEDYRSEGVEVCRGMRSDEKADWISAKEQSQRVLYIGDGLNDCEGFRRAFASLALESGSDPARAVARGHLLHDNLSAIPMVLQVAKESKRRLQQTLYFSFVYNLTGMALAASGVLHPAVAAVLMFASSLFVIGRVQSGQLPDGKAFQAGNEPQPAAPCCRSSVTVAP